MSTKPKGEIKEKTKGVSRAAPKKSADYASSSTKNIRSIILGRQDSAKKEELGRKEELEEDNIIIIEDLASSQF